MSEENQNQYPNETTIHFLSKTKNQKIQYQSTSFFQILRTAKTNPWKSRRPLSGENIRI